MPTTPRRPGWQSDHRHRSNPPPPSPRILQLPRRCRKTAHRKPMTTIKLAGKPPYPDEEAAARGKLGTLLDRERSFPRTAPVVLLCSGHDEDDVQDARSRCRTSRSPSSTSSMAGEGWRFQSEILRAECNLLRLQRDVAEKKLSRTRSEMERWLKIVIDALNSAKDEIGQNSSELSVKTALRKKVRIMEEKIHEFQRRSGRRGGCNLDSEASILRRQLEELEVHEDQVRKEEEEERNEAGDCSEAGTVAESFQTMSEVPVMDPWIRSAEAAVVGKKLENLSTGMIDSRRAALQIEAEFRTLLTLSTATDSCRARKNQPEHVERKCSESCRATIRRIVAHIQAEMKQWSQMQWMLHQVKEEMEELQASRDLWQACALEYERKLQTLRIEAEEWKQRFLHAETKSLELQKEIIDPWSDPQRAPKRLPMSQTGDAVSKPMVPDVLRVKKTAEMEKQVIVRRLKENSKQGNNRQSSYLRSMVKAGCSLRAPLCEVGNERISRCREGHFRVGLEVASS